MIVCQYCSKIKIVSIIQQHLPHIIKSLKARGSWGSTINGHISITFRQVGTLISTAAT